MWEDENDASRDGGLGNSPQLGPKIKAAAGKAVTAKSGRDRTKAV